MIILTLLLATAGCGQAHTVSGQERNGACVCEVNSTVWAFPTAKFDVVTGLLQTCQESVQHLHKQTETSANMVPQMEARMKSVKKMMEKFQYLNVKGLYNALHLTQLSHEIQHLHDTINSIKTSTKEAERIRTELQKLKTDVEQMHKKKVFNLEVTRDKLRSLHNRVQACRSIPQDFRSSCSQRVMSKISAPVVTKMNPFSSSYIAGAWGHDAALVGNYWVQSLSKSHMLGLTVRFYQTYEDLMAGSNYKDTVLANSYSDSNTIQGPGTIVYRGVVYYQCYYKPEICAYDVNTKSFRRLAIPDAGYNNKFPYCYYNCFDWTDINLSADDKGLWVIYATEANHGNVVVSRVDYKGFNVTHTWKTRLFKRSVTNAFMVCGVLYATRFVDTYKEEIFYAFDTSTGAEDNTLSIPMEKVAAGVASLHYNPLDMKLYMYNNGYMIAYQAYF